MNADSLQKLLAVINDAPDVPDEDKADATKALASDFADDMEVDDGEVDEAIDDAGMREGVDSSSDEEKTATKDKFKKLLQKQKAKAFATAKPAKAAGAPAQFSAGDIGKIVQEAITKAMPGQGRTAAPPSNPTAIPAKGATGFSSKIKGIKDTAGVTDAKALLMARSADPKGYNEWVAAGRPQ